MESVADAHTYTSFALSNEAIEKLPEHVKSIIRNPPPDISPLMINFDFVTIHGLGSKVLPRELMKNETLTAYNLEKLSVQVSEMDRSATITNIKGGVSVHIIESSVLLSTGIVHIIDFPLAAEAEFPHVARNIYCLAPPNPQGDCRENCYIF